MKVDKTTKNLNFLFLLDALNRKRDDSAFMLLGRLSKYLLPGTRGFYLQLLF